MAVSYDLQTQVAVLTPESGHIPLLTQRLSNDFLGFPEHVRQPLTQVFMRNGNL